MSFDSDLNGPLNTNTHDNIDKEAELIVIDQPNSDLILPQLVSLAFSYDISKLKDLNNTVVSKGCKSKINWHLGQPSSNLHRHLITTNYLKHIAILKRYIKILIFLCHANFPYERLESDSDSRVRVFDILETRDSSPRVVIGRLGLESESS